MKATFEFSLPEEKEIYEMYSKSSQLYSALWEIQQHMRKLNKYGHSFNTTEDAIQSIYDYINEEVGHLLEN